MADGDMEAGKVIESVEFKDVSLTYLGAGAPSLNKISFTASKGELIGIIGGTGSGKTSLINLIPRFYDASEGKILVNGNDVKEYGITSLRENIAVVPQKAALFAGSIRKNMKMGNENASDEEIWEALDVAMAADFVKEKPEGISYELSTLGRNLSGGQRQRITIARALVKNAGILIMDDSLSALDMLTESKLREKLIARDNRPIIFLVSQRIASLVHADKILVLDEGNLVGIGKHEELLASCKVYKEIYESQFGGAL